MSVPAPFVTTGLVDTGASHSALHPMIVQNLDLIPHGFAPLVIPGQTLGDVTLYDARLALGLTSSISPPFELQAPAIAPATTGALVIIGRDILGRCALLFDGENQAFSLWY